jgi:hypothetical protein
MDAVHCPDHPENAVFLSEQLVPIKARCPLVFKKFPRLGVLILATGIAVFAALKYLPGQSELNRHSELDRRYASCAAAMTSACLADLGFAEASRVSSLPRYVSEIVQLGQIGHLVEAYTLERRVQEASGLSPEAAKVAADRRLASLRITAAIRAGETVRQAFDQTPQADGGALWISALDLLGQRPYGMSPRSNAPPDATARLRVAAMAGLIASLAQGENPRSATSHLVYAARLQAMLQDRKAAIASLGHLPTEGREGIILSDDLLQVIGAEVAVPLCGQVVECEIWTRIRLAVTAGDAASARDDLQRLFSTLADRKPWPDFGKREEVVALAAKGGDRGEALVLARRLLETAKTKPDVFPVFAFISAARALAVAGADDNEVRQSLSLAEAGFPQNPKTIVGFGFNAGPIQWGGFGLEAQARREIAGVRARLGDLDVAKTMMEGIQDPAFAWRDILTPDIPVAFLDPLLQTAGEAMSEEDFSYVRACLAQGLVLTAPSGPQAAWAKATATDILRAEPLVNKRASITYRCISWVGYSLKNDDLYHKAVERMGQAALASGDFVDLFRAAIAWHGFETTAKE